MVLPPACPASSARESHRDRDRDRDRSGIFLIPSEMMRDTGSSLLVYLAWIVGGLLSLFGAMTYAELATMMPYAGGEYVYLRGAYETRRAFSTCGHGLRWPSRGRSLP